MNSLESVENQYIGPLSLLMSGSPLSPWPQSSQLISVSTEAADATMLQSLL